MDTEGIERINRHKEIADHIGMMVDDWIQGLDCEIGRDGEEMLFDWENITIPQWNELQEAIERYLNERDSK